MELKGSKTEKNLLAAFAGESQARTRYSFFASTAKKEGYEQISAIFSETSENEKEHAKLFFTLLKGGEAEIIATYPAGIIATTVQNLKTAADGEKMEWGTLYPRLWKDCTRRRISRGGPDILAGRKGGGLSRAKVPEVLEDVEKGFVFKKAEMKHWKCRNCGYVHDGTDAPLNCPVCSHPRAYFELYCENY